ncbi:MAG: GAF domain-containing protein [Spirochaetes bacterium]|nr:GAF domain-containing protein [Spirochaetota bacterium]
MFSLLPILNFLLDKFDSVISPAGYKDIYAKTIDSILNIESFDEILLKIFGLVIRLLKAEFGHTIYYRDDKDVIDIEYYNNDTHKMYHREKLESDHILLKVIKGPDDIIIKTKNKKPSEKDKEIIKALGMMRADLVVPIFYNNKISGIIAVGGKKGFSEKDIKLLKIIAFKLALLSSNSFYFNEIRKRREVEKEYELTNKIQKQFLPEPSLKSGRIIIEAHHSTASYFTREFYDIFVNDAVPDDIRLSAYHVFGDVKETSIFMPGVQAILQSYARLDFSPRKTIIKLKKFVKERDVLNGDLMILHSSIKQSGEFICYCSNYPAPFLYHKSQKKIVHPASKGRGLEFLTVKMKPGDIIIVPCSYYSEIIKSNITQYSKILNKNSSLPLEDIKNILVKIINDSKKTIKIKNTSESEDQLLILISMEDIK